MMALVARQGRHMQRYSPATGRRLVVGCIPYKLNPEGGCGVDQLEVLMVSSRKGNAILFPKGGWENDEEIKEAASREALEEAGVQGIIEGRLGKWRYKSRSHDAFNEGIMFALNVTEELDVWPEMDFRRREWVSVARAMEDCPHLWMKKALGKLVRRLSSSTLSQTKPISPA